MAREVISKNELPEFIKNLDEGTQKTVYFQEDNTKLRIEKCKK